MTKTQRSQPVEVAKHENSHVAKAISAPSCRPTTEAGETAAAREAVDTYQSKQDTGCTGQENEELEMQKACTRGSLQPTLTPGKELLA